MSKIGRVTLLIFAFSFILFLGLIFSGWVVPNIVRPAAETIWLFLRVFILNVDQANYWNVFTLAIVIWAIYRLIPRKVPIRQVDLLIRSEAANNLKNWQEFINYADQDDRSRDIAKEKLLRLVISHYAVGQLSANQAEIRQGLEQGRLPLPVSVYHFLFASQPDAPDISFIEKISQPFRRWQRRINGQEKLAFNNMLDELIDFMDS